MKKVKMLSRACLFLVSALLLPTVTACGAGASYGAMKSDMAYEQASAGPMAMPEEMDFDDAGGGMGFDGAPAAPAAPGGEGREARSRAPAAKTAGEPQGGKDAETVEADKGTAQVVRYIIYSATMGMFVESVEGAHESVEALVKKHNGWIKSSQNTQFRIRVPAAKFEPLIEALKALGDVQHVNKTGQDVTEEFFDLQARLANAEHMRQRYIQLLAKAKNVKESLEIERELGRITEIIERHKGRLKYLKNHVAFSTIVITLQPKPNELPKSERIALPFYWLRDYNIDALVR